MKPDIVVCLVRDTCRISDNPSLSRANILAKSKGAIMVPLACLEPRRWAGNQYGLPRIGMHWSKFRAESLRSLRYDLIRAGSGLWISNEDPVHAINRINLEFTINAVVSDVPIATEERLELERLQTEGYYCEMIFTDDLFRFEQLPFPLDTLPESFSKFRKIIEKGSGFLPDKPREISDLSSCTVQPWHDPPELTTVLDYQINDHIEVSVKGGESSAITYWNSYLDAKALSHYKLTRNAFCGAMQSTHLSAWLAHGCISARKVWWDIINYEASDGANESTYWLRFELLWREYFRWYSRANDWKLFRRKGPNDIAISGNHDKERFKNWILGKTGCDIVDAAMRELKHTGWISNRARQLVASYLIYESNLDWRLGAAYFESQLVDYDVASNWGNWTYIAGVGADPRGGRIFNLDDQADRYDHDQSYRTRWLA